MDRDATDWTMDTTVAVKTVKVTEAFLRSRERGQAIGPGCHPNPLGFGTGAPGDGFLWLSRLIEMSALKPGI